MAGQIGTAFAVRNQRASVRSASVFTNRYLLAGIAADILLAAVFIYAPPTQALLGTSPLPVSDLLVLLAYLVIVWGADEFVRYALWRRAGRED
jgi:magnesium-transporting ATPase (P-type)